MDFNIALEGSGFSPGHKAVPLDSESVYDVLILGGGPAGLTAAVYCMRKGVRTGLITTGFGGQVAETTGIENYMGYTHIEGAELVRKFTEQVNQFEIAVGKNLRVTGLIPGNLQRVMTGDGRSFRSRAVIVATGKSPRRLNIEGEKKYTGRGVAYCAACDAPFFKGKEVVVVGGGNSGMEAAIDLARVAGHVTVVEYLDQLKADKILEDKARQFKNVDFLVGHRVVALEGNGRLQGVTIENRRSEEVRRLSAEGLFVEIGLTPNSGFLHDVLKLNTFGEVVVDCACRTSQAGIFAAGDVTSVPYKQIVIATGEGAKAALAACDFILKN